MSDIFIYFIKTEPFYDRVYIVETSEPESTILEPLKKYCPFDVKVHNKINTTNNILAMVDIQNKFRRRHMHGGWYDIGMDEVDEVVDDHKDTPGEDQWSVFANKYCDEHIRKMDIEWETNLSVVYQHFIHLFNNKRKQCAMRCLPLEKFKKYIVERGYNVHDDVIDGCAMTSH